MNREILNRLTHIDIEKLYEDIHDCISVICQKAHPTTYHDCNLECPFKKVCDTLTDAANELVDAYYDEDR